MRNIGGVSSQRMFFLFRVYQYALFLFSSFQVRCIPFMQVVLMLTTDLEATEDKDRAILDKLLQVFIGELKLDVGNSEGGSAADRDNLREMQLVVMRLFSVLMSRSKSWQGLRMPNASSSEASSSATTFVSHSTAGALLKSGCIRHSLTILESLLKFWKNKGLLEAENSNANFCLLYTSPSPRD